MCDSYLVDLCSKTDWFSTSNECVILTPTDLCSKTGRCLRGLGRASPRGMRGGAGVGIGEHARGHRQRMQEILAFPPLLCPSRRHIQTFRSHHGNPTALPLHKLQPVAHHISHYHHHYREIPSIYIPAIHTYVHMWARHSVHFRFASLRFAVMKNNDGFTIAQYMYMYACMWSGSNKLHCPIIIHTLVM